FTVAFAGPQNVRAETPLIALTPGTQDVPLATAPEARTVAERIVAVQTLASVAIIRFTVLLSRSMTGTPAVEVPAPGPGRVPARERCVVPAPAVARRSRAQDAEPSAVSCARSVWGSVRCLPPTSSTVLPLTVWACVFSQSVPATAADDTVSLAMPARTMLLP